MNDIASGLLESPTLNSSDSELLMALSAGNKDAFWLLWSRYKEDIGRVCLKEMDWHLADAQDAVSEVMIKALACLPSQAGKILCVDAWLCRMARNLCVDMKRERGRWFATMEKFRVTLTTLEPVALSAFSAELETEVQIRVNSLPPFLKEPFVLHAVEEMPSEKVATQLGMSPANVRKRAQLARAKLRSEIESNADVFRETETDEATRTEEFSQRRANVSLGEHGVAFVGTACVRLPCGAEQLFHVFSGERTFVPERRINSLRAYLLKHPGSWRSRAQLAEQYYIVGCWNEAVAEWQKIVEKQRWLSVGLRLGSVLLRLGERAAATEAYDKIKCRHLWSPPIVHLLNGWSAFARQDAERAIVEFTTAAELEPKNPAHLHGLSLAYRFAGNRAEALKTLERALALDENDRVALSDGHDLLVNDGKIDEAAKRAQRLLQLHPSDFLTTWRLVDCLGRMGVVVGDEGRGTKAFMRRVGKHHENVFYTREALGSYFMAKGEEKKAATVCRKFLASFPQCPRAQKSCSRFPAKPEDRSQESTFYATEARRVGRCNGACFWNGVIESAKA